LTPDTFASLHQKLDLEDCAAIAVMVHKYVIAVKHGELEAVLWG